MKGNRVLIIGGGASGLAAAVSAAEAGDRVLVLEASSRPGRKVLASGNGRCNLMNLNAPAYHGETDFALRVLNNCPPAEIRSFWNRLGLPLREEEGGLVYPFTLQASSVMEALNRAMDLRGVRLLTESVVTGLVWQSDGFLVRCEKGNSYEADRVIVAAGGPAQPRLGGNEWGPALLKPLGHHAIPFTPALTPLLTDKRSVSGLSGIRVRCAVTLISDGASLRRESGELLFTDDGVSGICVMQCARFVIPGKTVLEIDLIPELFPEPESGMKELKRRREYLAACPAVTLLQGICLPKLAFAVCKQAGFALREETCGDISDEGLERLYYVLRHYRLQILGLRGYEKAQVSAGGLICGEFNPENMESLLCPGLHACGEALNVDGECGGYNLMFAWAGGILAGRNGRMSRC